MSKSFYQCAIAVVACAALATVAFAAPKQTRQSNKSYTKHTPTSVRHHTADSTKEKVTLQITGAEGAQAAAAINKAFAGNGLHASVHETKGQPFRVVTQVDRGADLSQWSKAVMSAETAKKGQPAPNLELVIFAPLTKESATQAMAQLEKIKGVDAKHSLADIKGGELRVRITGQERVTPDEISSAVQSAGIAGHFTQATRGRQS